MQFKYTALDAKGNRCSGAVEADAELTAKEILKAKGLYPINVTEIGQAGSFQRGLSLLHFAIKDKLPMKFARQLSSLLSGGIPLYQALSLLVKQTQHPKEREILAHIRDRVKEGASLSDALSDYSHIFDRLFVHSVKAGEKSGTLASILKYQAEHLEHTSQVKGKIKSALVYPAMTACVGTAVVVFLMIYVVPMVLKIFERMNQQLPTPTKILIAVSSFISDYIAVIIAIAIGSFILFKLLLTHSLQFKRKIHSYYLQIPFVSQLYKMTLAGRFARILSTLLRSGVPMLQALTVLSGAMKNIIVSEAIAEMATMVERGESLSSALRQTAVFDDFVADMAYVGENSGNLDEMFLNIATQYETETSRRIAVITSLIEPVVILTMGVVIAFVLVSILLPLFDMNKLLRPKP